MAAVCGKSSGSLLVLDFDSENYQKFWGSDKWREVQNETLVVKTLRGYHVWALDTEADFTKIDLRPALSGELLLNSCIVPIPGSKHESGSVHYEALGATTRIAPKAGFAKVVLERAKDFGYCLVDILFPGEWYLAYYRILDVVIGAALALIVVELLGHVFKKTSTWL